jgi:hypothetical protein
MEVVELAMVFDRLMVSCQAEGNSTTYEKSSEFSLLRGK